MSTGRLPLVVLLVALALAPLVLPEFYVTLLNYIGLYGIVALGLVLLTGVGGLTSFGQAASSAWVPTPRLIFPPCTAFRPG